MQKGFHMTSCAPFAHQHKATFPSTYKHTAGTHALCKCQKVIFNYTAVPSITEALQIQVYMRILQFRLMRPAGKQKRAPGRVVPSARVCLVFAVEWPQHPAKGVGPKSLNLTRHQETCRGLRFGDSCPTLTLIAISCFLPPSLQS